ncbi:hypothetical protein P7C73_g794, partial [Tremellales sp. Uapishka_1]
MGIPQVNLGGKSVGHIGYGLLGLSFDPKLSQEACFQAMKTAADAGATAWSTATYYGRPDPHHNLKLIAAFFEKYPEYGNLITLVVKGGLQQMRPVSDINIIREELLQVKAIFGAKPIDVYGFARLPKEITLAETFTMLGTLQGEGLFNHIGVSEMKAESLARALKVCRLLRIPTHATQICNIAVVEIEVSLWSFDQEIQAVVEWSKANSVPIFCYSPLGRGLLTGQYRKESDLGGMQAMHPRFQGDAFLQNIKLVESLEGIAERKGIKITQLALAWLVHISPFNIPIPGSAKPDRVEENSESANIVLTAEDLVDINQILNEFQPKGGRYPESHADLLVCLTVLNRTVF